MKDSARAYNNDRKRAEKDFRESRARMRECEIIPIRLERDLSENGTEPRENVGASVQYV